MKKHTLRIVVFVVTALIVYFAKLQLQPELPMSIARGLGAFIAVLAILYVLMELRFNLPFFLWSESVGRLKREWSSDSWLRDQDRGSSFTRSRYFYFSGHRFLSGAVESRSQTSRTQDCLIAGSSL
ncbi:hypothetical protein P7H74_11320 [Enterococcus devriesei]|uniref:hypothetical protein n=1 Tax=Enterococcus devriesei TaxID=319970 RepID=UPI001C115512|nr:hypothetical protein [Enterococcus devriesei]MBU5366053.1 hypothetical protein [Enterococcus devriesei]MDT2822332.1 hypothetical protein [Enterococcus devriesei]